MRPQRLPKQLDVHLRLPGSDFLQDSFGKTRELAFAGGAVHNCNTVSVYAEVAAAWIDHLKTITFLFADESGTQFVGVEEFDDLAFKEHEKISSPVYPKEIMSNPMLSPLTGSGLRIENKDQLDEFLARDEAGRLVKAASFEEVFFTVKAVGLADSMELLPLVTGRQIRGFIDLDCWRKDQFVRKPFMEWIAAFIQSGPEDTAKALSGVDEYVIALFLKEIIHVYEVDRDDPPDNTEMTMTPDSRFGVEPIEGGEPTTVGMLILDALFKFNPQLGTRILTLVRYTTRLELEETAYDNKNRRLEVHGFVDYYEAMSIYSGVTAGEKSVDRDAEVEAIPGEETTGNLPSVFVASLSGARLLLKALESVSDPAESERVAQELTALGNRILSANLVNLGELEGVRPALEEMRDMLTIGIEHLTDRVSDQAGEVLQKNYVQTIFKIGFDQLARLRSDADALLGMPAFSLELLDSADKEFVEALRRFKPLLIEEGRYKSFRSIADVDNARIRLQALTKMARAFLQHVIPAGSTFARAFNTATVRAMLYGKFEVQPLRSQELRDLEKWLKQGFRQPDIEVPLDLQPFAERWWGELESELAPLAGQRIDPRFVQVILVEL